MNTRRIGKIFIGIGILLIILYIVWIVFRVVKQPEQVEQGGLLPNPFDLLLPGERPGAGIVEEITSIEDITNITVEDIPTPADKRLFRISDSPALAFTLIEGIRQTTDIEPSTGESVTEEVPTLTVRYVTREEGFINDAEITPENVKTTRVSSAYIPGLFSADVSRYGMVGQYNSIGASTSTAFLLLLENPGQTSSTYNQGTAECSFDPAQIRLGDTSRDVENIQQFLTTYNILAAFEPGVFNEIMQQAVIDYQKKSGITPAEGFIGPKTIAQITKDCIQIMPKELEVLTPQQQEALDRQKISLLPKGIHTASIVNDSSIFMLLNSGTRNRGILRTMGTESDREIYNIPFIDWTSTGIQNGNVIMTTKPSGQALGHSFVLNPSSKSLVPILTSLTGLSVNPSPNGQFILYSTTEGGSPSLWMFDTESRETVSLDIATFAEKCTWAVAQKKVYCFVPQAIADDKVYPDEWYKRGTLFTDSLVVYSLESRSVSNLDLDGEIPAINADIILNQFAEGVQILVFRDWNTDIIWGYKMR